MYARASLMSSPKKTVSDWVDWIQRKKSTSIPRLRSVDCGPATLFWFFCLFFLIVLKRLVLRVPVATAGACEVVEVVEVVEVLVCWSGGSSEVYMAARCPAGIKCVSIREHAYQATSRWMSSLLFLSSSLPITKRRRSAGYTFQRCVLRAMVPCAS